MKKIYKTITTFIVLLCLTGTQASAQLVYCAQAAGSTADDEIFNVTIGTLNNTSACGQVGGPGSLAFRYNNYTALAAPALNTAQNYTLNVTVGQCNGFAYSGTIYAWIDYNQDGVFTHAAPEYFYTASGTFNIAGTVFSSVIPIPALPGAFGPTRMRITAVESGGLAGPCNAYNWGETEDYTVDIVGPPCSGAPIANSVVINPQGIACPNSTVMLSLANSYTNSGINIFWQSSTVSPVGPFTPVVPTPTTTSFASPPIPVQTWYQALITCSAAPGLTTTAVAGTINVQGVTTNTVPYFEGFEGITRNGQLPNCSWATTSPSTSCQTYSILNTNNRIPRTGSKFAAFNFNPGGTNSFFTNGIFLNAGVTYSAGLWFTTESTGFTNFTDLSITYGTTQNAAAHTTIVSTNGPAVSPIYKALGSTFTPTVTGLYYFGVRSAYSASGANFLSWDDLSITIPCTNSLNPVPVTVSGSTVGCAGFPLSLSASGANTYSWNTGATTPAISPSPNGNAQYIVTGTNTLTGCSAAVTINAQINPSPVVSIFAGNPSICAGQSVNLAAVGANNYNWSNTMTGNFITVSPAASTIYSVTGTNAFGCAGSSTVQITVKPLPAVTATPNSTVLCVGEALTLTGGGAVSYQWTSPALFSLANPVTLNPSASAIYTCTGTDASGCSAMVQVGVLVNACTGVNKIAASNDVNVYPNPNSGEFTIQMTTGVKSVEIMDLSGRLIMSKTTSEETMKVNISTLSNGIYYVKIKSNNATEVVKVVKQ